MKKIRVRFAPSPTGPLHLGGVRTALYNYLWAKQHNGDFLLRIEDTDRQRYVAGAEQYIMDALSWAGITPDEGIMQGGNYGPYRQSDRKDIYKQYIQQLLDSGNAYIAFDTPKELEDMRERVKSEHADVQGYNSHTRLMMKNSLTLTDAEVRQRIDNGEHYVIRIKIPADETITFEDAIRGKVQFDSAQLDDKVMFKSDGMPTYHFANVVDDRLMEISHVIRGEEWLSSTPIHVLLYRFMGWESNMPEFAHLPLILKPDGHGKLSKRDGDRLGFPVFPLNWSNPETGELSQGYKERGFVPEAFTNMLAFLGWNPGTEQEIFSPQELIDSFSIDKVSKHGAKFDFEKAKWFNQQHIKRIPSSTILSLLNDKFLAQYPELDDSFLLQYIELFKERVTFLNDFIDAGNYIFVAPSKFDEAFMQKKWKSESAKNLQQIVNLLEGSISFEAHHTEEIIKQYLTDNQIKIGEVFPLLRMALTSEQGGPHIFDIMALLGQEESIRRLNCFAAQH
jgi:glutamyl-tRNA synthetase